MKVHAKILCLLLTLSLILTVGTGCSGKNVIRVEVGLTPEATLVGMYVALENGYYEEEGLNVRFVRNKDPLSRLDAGRVEFATTTQGELGIALDAEKPVSATAVAGLVQHNTYGILSLRETGINDLSDLDGKRVASQGTPFESTVIRHLVERGGGNFETVEMVVDDGADAGSTLQTKADAILVDWASGGVAAKLSGLEYSFIALSDCETFFDYYAHILTVNDGWLAENPDKVTAFLKATNRGYAFAETQPEQAALILSKHAPGLGEELARASVSELADRYRAEAWRWGEIDYDRWVDFYNWMYLRGLLENLSTVGFSTKYLPG